MRPGRRSTSAARRATTARRRPAPRAPAAALRRRRAGRLVDLAAGGGEQRARGGQRRRRLRPLAAAGVGIVAPCRMGVEVAPDPTGEAVPARGDADAAVPEARPLDVAPGRADLGGGVDPEVHARRARVAGPHARSGASRRRSATLATSTSNSRTAPSGSVAVRRARSIPAAPEHHGLRPVSRQPLPSGAAPELRPGGPPTRRAARVPRAVGRPELVEDGDGVEVALGEPGERAVGRAELGERAQALHRQADARGRDPPEAREVLAQPGDAGRRIVVVEGHVTRQHVLPVPAWVRVRSTRNPRAGDARARRRRLSAASTGQRVGACPAGRRSPAPSTVRGGRPA